MSRTVVAAQPRSANSERAAAAIPARVASAASRRRGES